MTAADQTPHTRFTAACLAPRPPRSAGSRATRCACSSRRRTAFARAVPRPPRPPARRRRPGRRTPPPRSPPSRRRRSTDARSCCTWPTDLDDGDRWSSCGPRPTRRGRCSTRTLVRVQVGVVMLRSPRALAGRRLVADRLGNRLWRASVRGDLDRQMARNGRPDRLRLPRPALPAAELPDRLRPHPGSAEMASAGRRSRDALVTRLVLAGVQLAPVTLHTGVSSQEAGEAPGPEWFEVPPTSRADGQRRPRRRRSGDRGGDDGHPRLSPPSTGARRRRAGWTERVVTPPAAAHRRRAHHRLARPEGLAPAAGRGGRGRAASPRRRTTPQWRGATSGTSSATPRCCCAGDMESSLSTTIAGDGSPSSEAAGRGWRDPKIEGSS